MPPNPFTRAVVDGAFEEPPPIDVAEINAQATRAILETIGGIRDRGGPTRLLLLLGEPGIGKTHLLTRLRAKVAGEAVLSAGPPPVTAGAAELRLVDRVVSDLFRPTSGPTAARTQLDALIGRALAIEGMTAREPFALLDELAHDQAARTRRLNQRLIDLEQRYPEVEIELLDRILRLPFEEPELQRLTARWLRARALEWSELDRLGLDSAIEDDAAHARAVLTALSAVGSTGAPLVIAFDQVESLARFPWGFQAFARLMADLRRALPAGLIVLSSVEDVWRTQLAPQVPEPAREAFGDQILRLQPATLDEAKALARARAGTSLLAPINPEDVAAVHHADPRPRAVLRSLSRLWDARSGVSTGARKRAGGTGLQVSLGAALEEALSTRQDEDDLAALPTEDALAELIALLARAQPNRISELEVADLPERIAFRFRLDGTSCWVAVVDETGQEGFVRAVERFNAELALARQSEPAAHGVLLRDESLPLPSAWTQGRAAVETAETMGAKWVRVSNRDRVVLRAVRVLLLRAGGRELEIEGVSVAPQDLDAALVAWPEIRSLPLLWQLVGNLVRAPQHQEALPRRPSNPRITMPIAPLRTRDRSNLDEAVIATVRALQLSSLGGILERLRADHPEATEQEVAKLLAASSQVTQLTDDFYAWADE